MHSKGEWKSSSRFEARSARRGSEIMGVQEKKKKVGSDRGASRVKTEVSVSGVAKKIFLERELFFPWRSHAFRRTKYQCHLRWRAVGLPWKRMQKRSPHQKRSIHRLSRTDVMKQTV